MQDLVCPFSSYFVHMTALDPFFFFFFLPGYQKLHLVAGIMVSQTWNRKSSKLNSYTTVDQYQRVDMVDVTTYF